MKKNYIIIGSGPAGVSAAKALLDRGVDVTMLDAGVELEPARQAILSQLQLTWNEQEYDSLKHAINTEDNLKLSYGSDYPYQYVSDFLNITTDKNTYCMPSFARGGLSNLWGAYVSSYDNDDLKKWPIKTAELEFYYQKVKTFLPVTADYRHSKQADWLLKKSNQSKKPLESAGFTAAPAKLAVYFSGNESRKACFYCGNCQHGCPNNLIYTANDTLNQLLSHPQFTYINNVVVEKIIEQENDVTIFALELSAGKKPIMFKAERVFLAAGAIGSTKILLNSLNLFNHPVLLKDSQHFMLPCVMKKSASSVEKEKLHTLTQLSLRLKNESISNHIIHMQIYTFMDHYITQFKSMFKKLYPLVNPFLKPIINRMIIIQGFLHSDDSTGCEITLSADAKTLSLHRGNNVTNSEKKIKMLTHYLKKYHRQLGFFPLFFMTKISKTLRSYHYRGSFPMQAGKRTQTSTDVLGRPYGMEKVHVVDATVFPTIPAQAITLTIMANAYRIATECLL
ncbi:MAG: GMC oxidoreductase [Gammaproteobacteria bacterium]|nr:GMC oxidoreductase [Gammaproteobacteria bacterium]